jgi:alpha-beta hydrolase superfamily lysophospholipase
MRTTNGWDMIRSGPADAEHTVLLLPGGWCTAVFYTELMAEPAMAGIRLVAVTLPGNGGTPRAPELLDARGANTRLPWFTSVSVRVQEPTPFAIRTSFRARPDPLSHWQRPTGPRWR